jgi:heme-degrading monooxygenase HmoA
MQGPQRPPSEEAHGPAFDEAPLTARIWTGRAPSQKADEYREYLMEAGVKAIARIPGNRGVQMLVFPQDAHCEFMVISYWDSPEAIAGYAGPDFLRVRDLPRDSEFLTDRDVLARHGVAHVTFWPARDGYGSGAARVQGADPQR